MGPDRQNRANEKDRRKMAKKRGPRNGSGQHTVQAEKGKEMTTTNAHILNEAIRVTAERNSTHGSAEEQFSHCANLWSSYLGINISPTDVCQLMALLKMSRSKIGNPNVTDHYVDQCGYAALAGRMAIDNRTNLTELQQAVRDIASAQYQTGGNANEI
jgi:hypothetical protein